MGLFLRQQDQRTEVQKRVATELQERLKNSQPIDDSEPSMSGNEQYKTTSSAGMWVIVLLFGFFVATIIYVASIS